MTDCQRDVQCTLWFVIPIILLIGLPCLLIGCNSFICPLKIIRNATVLSSEYINRTCSTWFNQTLRECGHIEHTFQYYNGICKIISDEFYDGTGKENLYIKNQNLYILVDKSTNSVCQIPTQLLSNIIYVGVIFLILAFVFFIFFIWSGIPYPQNKNQNPQK